MAPNPRVARAFCAMRSIGIIEEKVKPVLKNLLKLYDKNWELIEEENYRALADAIFDQEETQLRLSLSLSHASEQKKKHENTDQEEMDEEAHMHEEPECPLKRLCLRNQNDHVLPSFGLGETSSRGPPKVEEADLPETCPRTTVTGYDSHHSHLLETKESNLSCLSPCQYRIVLSHLSQVLLTELSHLLQGELNLIWFLLQYVSREKGRNLSYLKLLQEFL